MSGKIEKTCADGDKHLGDVVCIAYQNKTIFTGGADGKIKVKKSFRPLLHITQFSMNRKFACNIVSQWKYNWNIFFGTLMQLWDDNLTLKKELNAHEAYVYAIAIDSKGRLYSTSCDGTLKMVRKSMPLPSSRLTPFPFYITTVWKASGIRRFQSTSEMFRRARVPVCQPIGRWSRRCAIFWRWQRHRDQVDWRQVDLQVQYGRRSKGFGSGK